MTDSANQPDLYFMQLVMSFQAAAWQQLGKVASPFSGKVERDLAMAKNTIDMLGMLQEKTKGNLTEDEKRVLEHALYELRLNYVDESKKSDGQPEEQKAESGEEKPADETKSEAGKDEPTEAESDSEK